MSCGERTITIDLSAGRIALINRSAPRNSAKLQLTALHSIDAEEMTVIVPAGVGADSASGNKPYAIAATLRTQAPAVSS